MTAHNRAAFSRADVTDAKRGRPDFDLRDYAACRGLEPLECRTPAGYRAVLPADEELQFNVLRGVLPGGVYGVLAHEALELGYHGEGLEWGGGVHGLRVSARGDGFRWRDLLGFLPVLEWLDWFGPAPAPTVRLPCTVVGVRVPETAAVQPCLRIDTGRSAPPYDFGERIHVGHLVGHRGWFLHPAPSPEPAFVERLLAEPVAGLLRAHSGDGLFQVIVWWGTLVIRRNGFLGPNELDELASAAGLIAERLRELCRPAAGAQPFGAELPRPSRHDGDPWCAWARATAHGYGLAPEDAVAYHRAFPSVPVPGMASVVLRGDIPHVGQGRLVVHRERDACRPAVLLEAPDDATTPEGGLPVTEHGLRLEVADGLLAAWSTTSYWGNAMAGDVEAFCAGAGDAIREWRG